MKLYTANCCGDPQNADYPNEIDIKSKSDFIRAMRRDHMSAQMNDHHRDSNNFLGCDCVMFDVDNTHTEDPAGWITAGDIAEALPVHYMLVRSRNYMREKRKTNRRTGVVTISEPREKWHVYAPLAHRITSAADFDQIIKNILCLFPFLDPAAIDTARFFFGVDHPHVDFEEGDQFIDEYLANRDPAELRQEKEQAIKQFAERISKGDYTDNKYTRLIVATGCDFLGIPNPLPNPTPATDPQQEAPAAEEIDDDLAWISEADQRRGLQWFEEWAKRHDVKLGRRYTINTPAHPQAICICVSCPWEDEHSGGDWPDNEAVVIVERSGKLDFVCRHSHGQALHWREYRAFYEAQGGTDQQQEKPAPAQQNPRPDSVLDYINNHMGDDIAKFAQEIKTGFPEFDKVAGGLYPGLYTIGAISSLGKTTFCAQLADQIAAAGHDVLFFSMEQSKLELVSKSIVRTIAKKDITTTVTSLDIRRGRFPRGVHAAAREYGESVGDRLSIIEGIFNCNIPYIADYVRDYIKLNDRRPVVFIDYLQILEPTEKGDSTKDTIDAAVKELKRLAHREGIPVIVISSLNRANYLLPVDFESFKESGMIEYSADVVLGLQFRCLSDPEFEKLKTITEKRERVKREKAATPRKLELVAIKNRYGISTYCVGFDYFPRVDLFREVDTEFETAEAIHDQLAEQEEANPWAEGFLNMRR